MRVMRPALLGLLAATSLGCTINIGDVSGQDVVTQARQVDAFERIELSGAVDVQAKVGPERSVVVEAAESVIADVETVVDEGALEVRMKKGLHLNPGPIRVTITAPTLSSLDISGSGDGLVEGVAGERFEVSVAGSGDVEVRGAVEAVSVSIAGSGNVDVRDLQAKTADVRISGSGDIRVTATETVEGSVSGSGDVTVHGGATCSVRVSGSGDVRC